MDEGPATRYDRRSMTSIWLRRACVLNLLLVASLEGDAQPQVAIGFNEGGLSSIAFNGSELLESGALRVHRVTFQGDAAGSSSATTGESVSVNAPAGDVTNTYAWGSVTANYQARFNRIDLTVTVTNTSSRAIQAVMLEPLELRLPSKPAEYDNVTP